jgi:hypothetical protein
MPPSRGDRLLFRAEPAIAKAIIHVDAIVITIAGHVVDALALAADVAFYRALSGRELSSRLRILARALAMPQPG